MRQEMISYCAYSVSARVKVGPSKQTYSLKRWLNHLHICSFKFAKNKNRVHSVRYRHSLYPCSQVWLIKLWVKTSWSTMNVTLICLSRSVNTHRHVGMPSLHSSLSLSIQPCCLPVFNIALLSGWAGSDMSGYSFLIVTGSAVHCFVWRTVAWNNEVGCRAGSFLLTSLVALCSMQTLGSGLLF